MLKSKSQNDNGSHERGGYVFHIKDQEFPILPVLGGSLGSTVLRVTLVYYPTITRLQLFLLAQDNCQHPDFDHWDSSNRIEEVGRKKLVYLRFLKAKSKAVLIPQQSELSLSSTSCKIAQKMQRLFWQAKFTASSTGYHDQEGWEKNICQGSNQQSLPHPHHSLHSLYHY